MTKSTNTHPPARQEGHGRPTKFTPEITEAILAALGIGATYKDAAEGAGVAYDTFNNWINQGIEEGAGPYFDFFEAVRTACAKARQKYLATIADASRKGEWRAAIEFLKRRDRSNWGDNIDVTTGGDRIKGYVGFTPDQWDEMQNADDADPKSSDAKKSD